MKKQSAKIGYSLAVLTLAFMAGGANFYSQRIPEGALWKKETVRKAIPPRNFGAALVWSQALTLSSSQRASGETARVTVDWVKLIEWDPIRREEKVVLEEHYDSPISRALQADEGMWFTRLPWFESATQMIGNSRIENGTLIVDVADNPIEVAHWWTKRIPIQPGRNYIVETRVKIEGNAGFQIGVDYWRDMQVNYNGYDERCLVSNNCEAWISDWFGPWDMGGQEFIVIRAPRAFFR